jgi:hypothetical protein
VQIDEAGRCDHARGIDFSARLDLFVASQETQAIAADRNVAGKTGRPRAIDDRAAPDQQIDLVHRGQA